MVNGIISYDITVNKFRNKLSKILSGYGTRIQYSVFEFSLEERIYSIMLNRIEDFYKSYIKYAYSRGIIDDITRSIRIYVICESCKAKAIVFDRKPKYETKGMII